MITHLPGEGKVLIALRRQEAGGRGQKAESRGQKARLKAKKLTPRSSPLTPRPSLLTPHSPTFQLNCTVWGLVKHKQTV
ncbi:MAG: hypothetical protein KME27_15530 [Lyngbya sp. HA4199-MV5]|nr:hypothetical protein [Lyngbya sp. HA4199-MV5]